MPDTPWLDDACSLVDAFRRRELSPLEALDASLAAIEASNLNAVCHTDPERARDSAAKADVSLPFGGVPFGIKELDRVEGWPYSRASLVFEGEVSDYDTTVIGRLRKAGAVLAAQTNASEFGGINCTTTRLHGSTGNPWQLDKTPGGSSGGTAASLAGGLLPIGTGGDGGGSIRIPAAFSGLFGLKTTFGRLPKGPWTDFGPLTAVIGCLSRSVRDTARYIDVTNGYDTHDPQSLPRVDGYETGLGASDLSGLRIAILPDLGGAARVRSALADRVQERAELLARAAGMEVVEVKADLPAGSMEWAMANMTSLIVDLAGRYPECESDLTPEIMFGLNVAWNHFDLRAAGGVESYRRKLNEAMADLFDQVDVVATSTNPDVAFPAAGPLPSKIDGVDLVAELGFERGLLNNGALTIPANLYGSPAVSIPIGTVDGLPIGMQVMAAHHREPLLLDIALVMEHEQPWPKVAPGAPC